MNQPNFTKVDEQLRAALQTARDRDRDALTNADHLHALLADLAPDMPAGLRSACVAVARTDATSWLTKTPPYSQDQVVAWLRAQYPDLNPEHAHQAVAAIAQLNGSVGTPFTGPSSPTTPATSAPVFDQQTVAGTLAGGAAAPPSFPPAGQAGQTGPLPQQTGPQPPYQPVGTDRPTVGGMQTQMPMHPSFPPNQGSWPPPPPPPDGKGRRTAIILAVVAVLLIGGGIGAFLLLKGGDKSKLAAPRNVSAQLDGFGSVSVSWKPVDGADHYKISDLTGGLPDHVVNDGTSYVFQGAASKAHKFVVVAVDSDGTAGSQSAPVTWAKRTLLPAPDHLSVTQDGNDISLTWDAVGGATTYELRDASDPSFTPDAITGTSYTVKNAVYANHSFTVRATSDSGASQPANVGWTPDNVLSDAEATLAYKLTDSMVEPGSCASDTADVENSDYVSAAVSCSPTAPGATGPSVLYALQITPGDQATFETKHFGNFENKGGCSDDFPTAGTRGTWNQGSGDIGDEFCFVATSGTKVTNVYAWTYYDENVVLQIEGEFPTDRNGLFAWWGDHATLLQ